MASTAPSALLGAKNPSKLTELLDRALRITTTDQRHFIGRFTCVDKECNIILNSAEEFLPPPRTVEETEIRKNRDRWYPRSQRGPGDESWARYAKRSHRLGSDGEEVESVPTDGRMLGMILIPGKMVEKIELIEEKHHTATRII